MGTARLPYTLYVFSASPPSPAASGATRRKDEGAGIWATQQDSNLRPSASHADALIPLSYGWIEPASPAGFEPAPPG